MDIKEIKNNVFNLTGLTRSNSQLVTPTPPPMPKASSISGSKREKSSHDNQGEFDFQSLYRLWIHQTFLSKANVSFSVLPLFVFVPPQPFRTTTLPGSPFSPLTTRSWCTDAGKITLSGMTRRWIICSCHLFLPWIPMMKISSSVYSKFPSCWTTYSPLFCFFTI